MDARVRIVLVEIVTMVLLLLTGHGEPAECSSDPSCEGFDAAPSENTIVPPGKDICLLCDYSNQIFNEKWRDENAVDVPTSSCSCTAMINGTGNSLCIQNFRNTTFYDCYVPIGTFSSCCTRAHLTLAESAKIAYSSGLSDEVDVGVGGTISLGIEVENPGVPEATFHWDKEGEELPGSDPRISFTDTSLTITGAMAEDRAEYHVTASNTAENVTLTFYVRVPGKPRISIEQEGDLLTCHADGFPKFDSLDLVTWSGEFFSIGEEYESPTRLGSVIVSEIIATADCRDMLIYTCTASTGGFSLSVPYTYTCPENTTDGPMLKAPTLKVLAFGEDKAQVEWSDVGGPAVRYTIEYKKVGDDDFEEVGQFISDAQEYSTTVAVLKDTEYVFRGTSFAADGTKAVSEVSFTISAEKLLGVVTGISADPISANKQIRLSWNMVENSTSYIIRVDPAIDEEDSFEVIETERLFTNVVCETEYRFTVQAKNEMIGLLSEISAPVEQRTVCYSEDDPYVIVKEVVPGATTMNISFLLGRASAVLSSISVTVTTVTTSTQEGTQFIYHINTKDLEVYTVCLGGLSPDTEYDVCLTATIASGKSAVGCHDDTVETMAEGAGETCVEAFQLQFNSTVAPTTEAEELNLLLWLVPVVVIAILALMAVLCTLGACMACRSDNKGSYNYGSNSSIDTSGNVQVANPHFQSKTSPSRSCLSYNTHSHNINWNQHMDTLRQMDKEGTSV